MTGTYEWKPMPHKNDVRCPSCTRCSTFEFVACVKIARLVDVPFFKRSKQFEYRLFQGSWAGQNWKCWEHSRYLVRSHGLDLGSITCANCGYRRRHDLRWPEDAFFQIEYRSKTLWAFHRESAMELRAFIAAPQRVNKGYRWSKFLMHVPKEFLDAKARATVTKRLDRLLAV
jgi:hypothetical protein